MCGRGADAFGAAGATAIADAITRFEISSAARDNRVVHALEGIRQAQDGDKANNLGTYAGIRRTHELDCYAAMGFPGAGAPELALTIQVLDGIAGKEGFDAMIRMCTSERVMLRAIGWCLLVYNRHA